MEELLRFGQMEYRGFSQNYPIWRHATGGYLYRLQRGLQGEGDDSRKIR
jgi:hypothetical protein